MLWSGVVISIQWIPLYVKQVFFTQFLLFEVACENGRLKHAAEKLQILIVAKMFCLNWCVVGSLRLRTPVIKAFYCL